MSHPHQYVNLRELEINPSQPHLDIHIVGPRAAQQVQGHSAWSPSCSSYLDPRLRQNGLSSGHTILKNQVGLGSPLNSPLQSSNNLSPLNNHTSSPQSPAHQWGGHSAGPSTPSAHLHTLANGPGMPFGHPDPRQLGAHPLVASQFPVQSPYHPAMQHQSPVRPISAGWTNYGSSPSSPSRSGSPHDQNANIDQIYPLGPLLQQQHHPGSPLNPNFSKPSTHADGIHSQTPSAPSSPSRPQEWSHYIAGSPLGANPHGSPAPASPVVHASDGYPPPFGPYRSNSISSFPSAKTHHGKLLGLLRNKGTKRNEKYAHIQEMASQDRNLESALAGYAPHFYASVHCTLSNRGQNHVEEILKKSFLTTLLDMGTLSPRSWKPDEVIGGTELCCLLYETLTDKNSEEVEKVRNYYVRWLCCYACGFSSQNAEGSIPSGIVRNGVWAHQGRNSSPSASVESLRTVTQPHLQSQIGPVVYGRCWRVLFDKVDVASKVEIARLLETNKRPRGWTLRPRLCPGCERYIHSGRDQSDGKHFTDCNTGYCGIKLLKVTGRLSEKTELPSICNCQAKWPDPDHVIGFQS